MPEEKVFFTSSSLHLEGLLDGISGQNGVVICHPHPLMGGTMHNNVVEAIQEVFAAENYATLRFNFRGVGGSQGAYDEGRGESEDIRAACHFMKSIGCQNVNFVGYSFGAWAGAQLIARENIFTVNIFVAPPIDILKFDLVNLQNKIALVICGENDQFCWSASLEQMIKKIKAQKIVIREADHFFFGRENELKDILHQNSNILKI